MKTNKKKTGLTLKPYVVISEAVHTGVQWGMNRAYKYHNAPTQETIIDAVEDEVMNSLCEVVDFGDDL